MIKSDTAYNKNVEKLQEYDELIKSEKKRFEDMGLSEKQIDLAIQPMLSFKEQIKEDLDYYEKAKRGEFEPVSNIMELGKMLIGYRIYRGMSQVELAEKLGVTKPQVSRDERNEYYGSSIEKISNVMKALGMEMTMLISIEDKKEI